MILQRALFVGLALWVLAIVVLAAAAMRPAGIASMRSDSTRLAAATVAVAFIVIYDLPFNLGGCVNHPQTVLPRLDHFQSEDVGTIGRPRERAPAYFILNADYARSVPPDTPPGRLVSGLEHQMLGYRMAFRSRAPPPWPWLPCGHPDLVGSELETSSFSILRDINPTIEVYVRDGR